MLTPQPPRRRLADKLDFICFVVIMLLCGALAVIVSTGQHKSILDSAWLLVPILPLALWLSAMTRLRKYLETSENDARRERRIRTVARKKLMFARSMGTAA